MKMLIALVKVVIFSFLTVLVGWTLYDRGGEFVRTTMEHNDPFTDGGKGFVVTLFLVALLVLCITGVRRSWVNRHQGSDTQSKRVRRRFRKIDDVIRIPK